jgi:hypothetical protein
LLAALRCRAALWTLAPFCVVQSVALCCRAIDLGRCCLLAVRCACCRYHRVICALLRLLTSCTAVTGSLAGFCMIACSCSRSLLLVQTHRSAQCIPCGDTGIYSYDTVRLSVSSLISVQRLCLPSAFPAPFARLLFVRATALRTLDLRLRFRALMVRVWLGFCCAGAVPDRRYQRNRVDRLHRAR